MTTELMKIPVKALSISRMVWEEGVLVADVYVVTETELILGPHRIRVGDAASLRELEVLQKLVMTEVKRQLLGATDAPLPTNTNEGAVFPGIGRIRNIPTERIL
jgi:hypothetical protein